MRHQPEQCQLVTRIAPRCRRSVTRTGHDLFRFQQPQQFRCALQNAGRQPSEPSYLDSVGTVSSTRLETVEKEHLVSYFAYLDVIVSYCY